MFWVLKFLFFFFFIYGIDGKLLVKCMLNFYKFIILKNSVLWGNG